MASDVVGSAVDVDEPLMAAGMDPRRPCDSARLLRRSAFCAPFRMREDSLSSVEFRNRLSAEAGAGIKFPHLGGQLVGATVPVAFYSRIFCECRP